MGGEKEVITLASGFESRAQEIGREEVPAYRTEQVNKSQLGMKETKKEAKQAAALAIPAERRKSCQ